MIEICCSTFENAGFFVDLVISYDVRTKTTTSYLLCRGTVIRKSTTDMLQIIDTMYRATSSPVALLAALYFAIVRQLDHVKTVGELASVRKSFGFSDSFYQSGPADRVASNFESIHGDLVSIHSSLTNGVTEYMVSFGINTHRILEQFNQMTQPEPSRTGDDISDLLVWLDRVAEGEVSMKQRLLAKIETYLQVVCSCCRL